MTQSFNVQKLLVNSLSDPAFLDELDIDANEEKELLWHRRTVRASLKAGFERLRLAAKQNGNDSDHIAFLTPKFWTQGSHSYRTLNNPAHTPPQQIDLDDGVYFPMELVNGKPVAAKNALLKVIWQILDALAKEKNWKLSEKPTCARLYINKRIHIDIPVYAIPRDKYVSLEEAALAANFRDGLKAESAITQLDPTEVYLAKWDDEDHWVQSDPKELEKWFTKEIRLHGERLRRVCRYLKAWRDHNWRKGGPSSIALMATAAQVFDDHLQEGNQKFKTDCQALLEVCDRLPGLFAERILNPVGTTELFPNGLGEEEVVDMRGQIGELSFKVRRTLCSSKNCEEVVASLQEILGHRVPSKPEWVDFMSVADLVKSVPPKPQAQPKPATSHRSA